MKKLFALLTLLVCLCSCQKSQKEVVSAVLKKHLNHKSVRYRVDYHYRPMGTNHIMAYRASVILKREEEDTLFHAKILYRLKDSTGSYIAYYKPGNLYLIDSAAGKIAAYKTRRWKSPVPDHTVKEALLKPYFRYPHRLIKQLRDKRNAVTYTDSANQVIVRIKYPSGDQVKNPEKSIYFSRKTKTIDKIIYRAQHKNQTTQKEWRFRDVDFSPLKDSVFQATVRPYFKHFPVTEH